MTSLVTSPATSFVVLGPHILDVLGRPVVAIPAGQGSARLEQLTITVAGTGGGTASTWPG